MRGAFKKLVVACALALGLAMVPGVAGAVTGYVCEVYYMPFVHPIYGDYGVVAVDLYSEPFCDGSYVDSAIAYTKNSTSGSSSYHYSERGILYLAAAMQRAAIAGQKVSAYMQSSSPYQLYYVRFKEVSSP
jgi:hypothetical protein